MTRMTAICVAAGVIAALSTPAQADDAAPKMAPIGQPMTLDGSFGFVSEKVGEKKQKKEIAKLRRSLSGVACAKVDLCLLGFDEGVEARLARLSPDAYAPDGAVVLSDEKGAELDVEGVATDGRFFFVVGSHSRKRNSGEDNNASHSLLRLKVGPDGRPEGAPERGDLTRAIEAFAPLAGAFDKPLDDGAGLDIEGVAVAGGSLFFGFRGPTKGGDAYILKIDAEAAFSGGEPRAELLTARVGERRAIRDMQAVPGGLLLLVGPDDDPRHAGEPFGLVLRDAAAGVSRTLAELDLSNVERRKSTGCEDAPWRKAKPEALRVVDPDAAIWRVAILSDGLCDGGPLWFDLKRP